MAGLGGQTLRERRSPHSKPRYTRAVAETAIRSVEPIEGLIAAAQAGDNEAFRHITEPYYREDFCPGLARPRHLPKQGAIPLLALQNRD